jgi:hypothetical protein
MVSRTGIGIGIGIPFMNKVKGGGVQPLPPDLQDALVGVWIADQNNNDSSNRDTIKNKIPNAGGDFELLNFAYKLNSGFGKYEEDFDSWIPQSSVATSTYSSNKLHVTNIKNGNAILYTRKATSVMKIKVTGMQSLELIYRYITCLLYTSPSPRD